MLRDVSGVAMVGLELATTKKIIKDLGAGAKAGCKLMLKLLQLMQPRVHTSFGKEQKGERPERGSIFSEFSAHADGERRGLVWILEHHRRGFG